MTTGKRCIAGLLSFLLIFQGLGPADLVPIQKVYAETALNDGLLPLSKETPNVSKLETNSSTETSTESPLSEKASSSNEMGFTSLSDDSNSIPQVNASDILGMDTTTASALAFSPTAGTYAEAVTVTLGSDIEGVAIYYTTDGSNPTTGSAIYSNPISVTKTTTIKAVATKEGINISGIISAEYIIVKSTGIGTDGKPVDLSLWSYSKNDNSFYSLLGYKGGITYGKIVGCVPAEINGLPVKEMIDTFSGCYFLTQAPEIPNSVTSMNGIFNECKGLTQAPVIPDGVVSMNSTFCGCRALTQAPAIPAGVTSLYQTFRDTGLTQAPEIPDSVTNMNSTFYRCKGLTEAPKIPARVSDLAGTFYECTGLSQAPEIPESVTKMDLTFYGCTGLKEAPKIPDGVTELGATFDGCTGLLQAPAIPSSVTSLIYTFGYCTGLTRAPEIPDSVTDMTCTFSGCSGLTQAPEIPDGVTNMSGTFSSCIGLTQAPVIPNSVTNMSVAFASCTGLAQAPQIPKGVTDLSYTFTGCTGLTQAPVIPDSVTNMYNTFASCTGLAQPPLIPDKVMNMSYTFYKCTGLTQAPALPDSVTDISSALSGCTALTGNVYIPNSVNNMNYIFKNTSKPIYMIYSVSNTAAESYPAPSNVTKVVDSAPPVISGVTSTTASSSISISAADNYGVSGYAVTSSPTAPTTGWQPSDIFSGLNDGTYYAWAKDYVGNVSLGTEFSVHFANDILDAAKAVEKAESTRLQADINLARTLVNALPYGKDKADLINRLNAIVAKDSEAPTVPTELTLLSTSSSSITVSWNASTDNIGVANYDIYNRSTLICSVSGDITTYTLRGLRPNTDYVISVRAKDLEGNRSAASNQVSVTTLLSTPNNITSTKTDNSITLTWGQKKGNIALGKSYTKSEQPDGQYSDISDKESTDGVLAGDFTDGNSYGYTIPQNTTKSVGVVIDLGDVCFLNNVKVHKWEGSGNYGADKISIYTSQDGVNYELAGSLKKLDSVWLDLSFPTIEARYIKADFSKYNDGGWGNNWLFIDEIQVYNNEAADKNLASGKAYSKSEQPEEQYSDNSDKESTDGVIAKDYSDGKSYGYKIAEGTTKSVDVIVDLGDIFSVNNVKVHKWEGANNYGADVISIYTSQDGTNYELEGNLNNTDGIWCELSFSNIDARYIKATFSKYNNGLGNDWLFIDEIQVYKNDSTKDVNLALGKSYSKSEQPEGLYSDNNDKESTDGVFAKDYYDGKSYGYRVQEGITKNVEVIVDLCHISSINNVKVHKWEGPNNYQADTVSIYTSNDGINYTLKGNVSNTDGIWLDLTFPTVDARYVKADFSKYNNGVVGNDWLFIDEIQVYNTETTESAITCYDIEADGTIIDSVTGDTYTHGNLESDSQHTYRVRAKNGDVYSEWSSPITVTTATGEVVNLRLSSLTISSGTLSPAFGKDSYSYTAVVDSDVTDITITPTALIAAQNSTITVNGTAVMSGSGISVPLSIGENTINVDVTSGEKVQRYTIIVTRENNTYLSNVKVMAGRATVNLDSTFNRKINNYTGSCSRISALTIIPTAEDTNVTIYVNGTAVTSGNRASVPVTSGQVNNFTITVKSNYNPNYTKTYDFAITVAN